MTKETGRKEWLKPNCIGNPDPLPEGNGKGYCPDRIDCTVQKHYPLPFALANGHKRKRHKGRFEKVVQGFNAVSTGMEHRHKKNNETNKITNPPVGGPVMNNQ